MQPAAVFAGLSAFLVYSTWAAFQGEHYAFGHYFLYLALGFIVFLSYDVWNALWFEDAGGGASFGVGVGALVLALNVGLLGGYTFSCHSLRHLVSGQRLHLGEPHGFLRRRLLQRFGMDASVVFSPPGIDFKKV